MSALIKFEDGTNLLRETTCQAIEHDRHAVPGGVTKHIMTQACAFLSLPIIWCSLKIPSNQLRTLKLPRTDADDEDEDEEDAKHWKKGDG